MAMVQRIFAWLARSALAQRKAEILRTLERRRRKCDQLGRLEHSAH